ncbi:MAG: VanW family protein [Clostridia bacterium]|nr:VanW family protein [Clostridia bacterium]
MSNFGNKQSWVLGACMGVLVLAGALCALLLSGNRASPVQAAVQEQIPATAVATATIVPNKNIVITTPGVDPVEEQHRQEIESIVIRTTMLPGTHVYGVDVSGMSREQAKAAVEEKLLKSPPTIDLKFTDGINIYPATGEGIHAPAPTNAPQEEDEDDDAVDPAMKAAEAAAGTDDDEPAPTSAPEEGPVAILLKFDAEDAVNAAFSLMRDSTVPYDLFMAQVQSIAAGKDIAPVPSYDQDSVDRYVAKLSSVLDTPAVNASLGMENNQLVYKEEATGHGVDQAALIQTILETDPLAGETIDIPMHELEPTMTKAMLQDKFILRGAYTTSFSDSTKNRKYNIRFGADKINGTILKPGDVFSANDTLGKRTRKNGWKNAGAYESGEVVQQAGGGVCQLSSTLYNAALYADMKIVERRNHSMPVHYVSKGRDATINSIGNLIDFKFENNTSSDVIIIAYTEGNNLHMEIYGVPFETDEYDRIEIRTKQRGSQSIKTVYEYLDDKPTSYQKTVTKGSKGYTIQTYKDYYSGDTLVKTDDLGISKYTMFPKKVQVGTISEDSGSDSSDD